MRAAASKVGIYFFFIWYGRPSAQLPLGVQGLLVALAVDIHYPIVRIDASKYGNFISLRYIA